MRRVTTIALVLGLLLGSSPGYSANKKGSDAKPAHQKGRAPRTPASQLPPEASLPEANARVRKAIAEGDAKTVPSKLQEEKELSALRRAEEILFPHDAKGLEVGWSFALPEATHQPRILSYPGARHTRALQPEISAADLKWLRSLTLPDLPVHLDQRVVTYLKFYRDSHRGRTIAAIWARKAGRYVAAMKAELRRAGLPSDLIWLSMIESGHNPVIRSPAGAVGLWQFMPETGRMYGLTVDRWVDERRDPARATQAAIRFLGDLHQRFGNWELAMGAYNMGYAGMSRAIAKYNSNDYWTLSRLESGIPWETTLYVPKIFALAIVMNNREAFGLGRIKADATVSFDTILVLPATSFKEVAEACGAAQELIAQLNPQYLAGRLPPEKPADVGSWKVRVPRGTGRAAAPKLAKKEQSKVQLHQLRYGEGLREVAQLWGVSERSLRATNRLVKREVLPPGTLLILPKTATKLPTPPAVDAVVVARRVTPGDSQKLVFYRTQGSESLEEIASHLGVSTFELARYNSLNPRAKLRARLVIQALVSDSATFDKIALLNTQGAQVLLAGSPEFHSYFEGLKGKRRVTIAAQKGDTLHKIGRKYGMSVGSMERVNRRSRRTSLVPGQELVVYTNKPVASDLEPKQGSSLPAIVAPRPNLLPRLAGQEKEAP